MKQVQLTAIGNAPDVVKCVEVADLPAPGPGQVVVEVAAGPINPAEILIMKGEYAATPPLPAPLGIEGAGTIAAIGPDVTSVAVGDKVMTLARTNWVERLMMTEAEVIKLDPAIDLEQAAMLKVNPATAFLMLRDYVDLKPGDWVIQNTGNSGVGTSLIRLAKARGLKTVSLVRRQSAVDYCLGQGGDVALIDGDEIVDRVKEATGGADIRLGIDAVAGEAVIRLASCLADGGVVVNYGMLSGDPCMLTTDQTVFQSKSLTGFWLAKKLGGMARPDVEALYAELTGFVADGSISVPIEARYTLDQISEAVAHAEREGRGGKILMLPNG